MVCCRDRWILIIVDELKKEEYLFILYIYDGDGNKNVSLPFTCSYYKRHAFLPTSADCWHLRRCSTNHLILSVPFIALKVCLSKRETSACIPSRVFTTLGWGSRAFNDVQTEHTLEYPRRGFSEVRLKGTIFYYHYKLLIPFLFAFSKGIYAFFEEKRLTRALSPSQKFIEI